MWIECSNACMFGIWAIIVQPYWIPVCIFSNCQRSANALTHTQTHHFFSPNRLIRINTGIFSVVFGTYSAILIYYTKLSNTQASWNYRLAQWTNTVVSDSSSDACRAKRMTAWCDRLILAVQTLQTNWTLQTTTFDCNVWIDVWNITFWFACPNFHFHRGW